MNRSDLSACVSVRVQCVKGIIAIEVDHLPRSGVLDAEAIFWFASTIAQCVVALLAFAAFLAVWRARIHHRVSQGDG